MIRDDEVRYLNLSNQAAALINRMEEASANFEAWKRRMQRKLAASWLLAVVLFTVLCVIVVVEVMG